MSSPNLPGAPDMLSAVEIFRGRNVMILGSTGFLGKVLLSMLLDRFPQIGRIYVMVRSGSGTDSETRFWNYVVPSPTFNPLRDRYGDKLTELLRDKIRVIDDQLTPDIIA